MTGFLGQKFDFTGADGDWYALIADVNMNVNMRVTSPVVDLPEITYITGTRGKMWYSRRRRSHLCSSSLTPGCEPDAARKVCLHR